MKQNVQKKTGVGRWWRGGGFKCVLGVGESESGGKLCTESKPIRCSAVRFLSSDAADHFLPYTGSPAAVSAGSCYSSLFVVFQTISSCSHFYTWYATECRQFVRVWIPIMSLLQRLPVGCKCTFSCTLKRAETVFFFSKMRLCLSSRTNIIAFTNLLCV